nr:iron-sulfur cluster-binding protein [Clostridia bacterium]
MNYNQIMVIYGSRPQKMVPELLDAVGLVDELKKDFVIGIKPNLVVAKESSSGATTDPELVGAVVEYLKAHGFNNLLIMESSWVGESTRRAFRVCGYEELSRKYGVPLIDLKGDACREVKVNDLTLRVCNKPLEVHYLINMPVLKAHCQTKLTCALKNLKGCIPDSEKRRFHSLGLHKPIACLGAAIRAHLTIVDAIVGDLTFEEGGTPVQMNRLIAGKDPVLIDAYAAQLIGYEKDDIPYISMAEKLGVGSADLTKADIVELNQDTSGGRKFEASRRVASLAKYVVEKDACSACYGSLMYALERLRERGRLNELKSKLYIGQGFRGKKLEGIGIGSCTRECSTFMPGCPPKAKDIVEFLESVI